MTNQNYSFTITNNYLKELVDSARDVPNKNYKQLQGSKYIGEFEKMVSICENHDVKIQLRNSAIYENANKSTTVYIRINGDCKQCNTEKVKYIFTIKKKPSVTDIFVPVNADIIGQHNHNHEKKVQIRGDERKNVAEQIRLVGGAHAYGLEFAIRV